METNLDLNVLENLYMDVEKNIKKNNHEIEKLIMSQKKLVKVTIKLTFLTVDVTDFHISNFSVSSAIDEI